MPLLDSFREEFTERNVPLHLALGLLSTLRRLDSLPSPSPKFAHEHEHAHEVPAGDDRLLFLILGLVSFRRTFLNAMEPLAPVDAPDPPSSPVDAAEPPPPDRPERLLR